VKQHSVKPTVALELCKQACNKELVFLPGKKLLRLSFTSKKTC